MSPELAGTWSPQEHESGESGDMYRIIREFGTWPRDSFDYKFAMSLIGDCPLLLALDS